MPRGGWAGRWNQGDLKKCSGSCSSQQSTRAPCRQPRPRMPQKGGKGKASLPFSPGGPLPERDGDSDPGGLRSALALPATGCVALAVSSSPLCLSFPICKME